jgi:hypothetical protein
VRTWFLVRRLPSVIVPLLAIWPAGEIFVRPAPGFPRREVIVALRRPAAPFAARLAVGFAKRLSAGLAERLLKRAAFPCAGHFSWF